MVAAPNVVAAEEPKVAAPPRLSIQGVSLTIGERIVLDDVGFDVAAGEIVGILGPNGSGKTSLMRCLTGLLRPDRGTARLDGEPLSERRRDLRARIGVVFQEPSLDDRLTARENLVLAAGLFAIPRKEAEHRAKDLLAFMELADRADDAARTLSGGMRRRLELARALINEPHLLLLDEPTSGLDPHAYERTWQRLRVLRRERAIAMVVSTHRPDEAERCDRLFVLDRGHRVADGTPQKLLESVAGDVLTLDAPQPERLVAELAEHFGIAGRLDGQRVLVQTERGHELIPRLVESFPAGRFRSIQMRRPSLSDVFFHLTGRTLEEIEGT
jgi:ABC-2 type transport system ATP-binding protein